jgi:hypothetical protein
MSDAKKTTAMAGIIRPERLAKLDGRTREARRLRAITADLTEHCGGAGRVSAAQRYLIQRTAVDLLRLELLDVQMATGTLSEHTGKIAHALRSSVRLSLRQLGMAPAKAQPLDAVEYLAAKRAGHAAA